MTSKGRQLRWPGQTQAVLSRIVVMCNERADWEAYCIMANLYALESTLTICLGIAIEGVYRT